jgi:hypothetical protein
MSTDKTEILKHISYTELVYGRINKKLGRHDSKLEIEQMLFETLRDTPEENFHRVGKNFYVTNLENDIVITINASTKRVITVDRLSRFKKHVFLTTI